MHAATQNQLVLQRVLPPRQLGDGHLVTEALQRERANHVGQVRAEFAAVPCVLEERVDRSCRSSAPVLELLRHLGLAAGNERHVVGVVPNGRDDRVIGSRVAGVKGGQQVDALRKPRLAQLGGLERHAIKSQLASPLARAFGQLGPTVHRPQLPFLGALEKQVVENEAQVRIAAAGIDDRR